MNDELISKEIKLKYFTDLIINTITNLESEAFKDIDVLKMAGKRFAEIFVEYFKIENLGTKKTTQKVVEALQELNLKNDFNIVYSYKTHNENTVYIFESFRNGKLRENILIDKSYNKIISGVLQEVFYILNIEITEIKHSQKKEYNSFSFDLI